MLNKAATQKAAEEAIEKVRRRLTPERELDYWGSLWITAKIHPILKADQVWEWRGRVGDDEDDGSALGPVMKDAHKLGWLTHLDYKPSERPVTHKKPLNVWRSRIYDPYFVPPKKEDPPPSEGFDLEKTLKCERCGQKEWVHAYAGADHAFIEKKPKEKRKQAA